MWRITKDSGGGVPGGGLLVLACLAIASSALAAEPPPPARPIVNALHVEPNACFDAATLAPDIAAWLRRREIDRRIDVDVHGDPSSPEGVTIDIQRDGRIVGTRTLPAFAIVCDDVRAAVAAATALAIESTVLESLDRQPFALAKPPSPAPTRDPFPAPPRVATALEGVAVVGVLPSPAAGFVPSVSYSIVPSVALRAGVLLTAPRSSPLDDGGKVDVQILAGRCDACSLFPTGAFRLRVCVGMAAGELHGFGSGFPRPTRPASAAPVPWVVALARLDLRIPLAGALGFVIGSDVVVSFLQSSVDAGTSSTPLSQFGVVVGGGPEVKF